VAPVSALRREFRRAGIEIEVRVKKNYKASLMRKRNKRTEVMAHMELAPMTEHILANMGQEGDHIRKRLKHLYRQRTRQHHCRMGELLEQSA
jgi:hypothetical protein